MVFIFQPQKEVRSEKAYVSLNITDIIRSDFNEELFNTAIYKYPIISESENQKIYGLIVPHHDLASDLIAEAMQYVSASREINKIVILGPNHVDEGSAVISYPADFQAQNGIVNCDLAQIEELQKEGYLVYNKAIYEPEHSIKTLIPFIKEYFPKANVIPMIFTSRFNSEAYLSQKLNSLLNENTLIISSIDFSHYLDLKEAEQKDKETKKAILNWDYEFFNKFDSDYLDSPASLKVLMRTMKLFNSDHIEILNHNNSARLNHGSEKLTTSYFTITFSK